jgi:hypothetical protein
MRLLARTESFPQKGDLGALTLITSTETFGQTPQEGIHRYILTDQSQPPPAAPTPARSSFFAGEQLGHRPVGFSA